MIYIILLILLLPVRVKGEWRVLFTTLFTNSDSRVEVRKEYLPNKPLWFRRISWFFRNPMHDFTFYVIGFNGKVIRSWGSGNVNLTLQPGFHWAIRHPWRTLWFLPYLSYQKDFGKTRFLFYIGWRPQGAFGFKFRTQRLK